MGGVSKMGERCPLRPQQHLWGLGPPHIVIVLGGFILGDVRVRDSHTRQ